MAYGEVDPDDHDLSTIDENGKCGCGQQAPISGTNGTDTYYAFDADGLYTVITAMLEDGERTFTFNLPADAATDMLTAIRDAFNNTDGVEDGSIDLTLDGVTAIGISAFSECSALASVMIPATVTEIGESAFDGCSSLTSIYYGGTASAWETLSANAGIPDTATVYYYSAEKPAAMGNYWHYANGVPTTEWDD